MAEDDFGREVLRVMASGPPSSGDNLLGMEIDFTARLADLQELDEDSVVVQSTESPECLIRAKCQAAKGVTVARAAEAVREAWLTTLRYSFLEANRVTLRDAAATFEFVTQIGPGSFFVTGRVEVLPAR